MASYWIMKFLSALACVLPAGMRRGIGYILGRAAWFAVPAWRKNLARENIKSCLGVTAEQAEQIARESVYRFGHMIMVELYFPRINKDNIKQVVTIVGEEHLQAAYALGRGGIIISAHYGNWELSATAIALAGYREAPVGRRQNNPGMDRFITEYREMHGARPVYKTGVLEMTRLLSEGFCLGLVMDQDGGADGVKLNFLGRESSMPQGPAALSRLKNAPIIPVFSYSTGPGKYVTEFFPAVFTPKTKDREADIRGVTQQLTELMEEQIRLRPQEWFWIHDRWKSKKNHKI